MTSRLERLGARLLGHAPALAPRIASRFETPADSTAAISTIESDRSADASPSSQKGAFHQEPSRRLPREPLAPLDRSAPSPGSDHPGDRLKTPPDPGPPDPSAPRSAHSLPSQLPLARPTAHVTAASSPRTVILQEQLTAEDEPSSSLGPTGETAPVTQRDFATELRRLRAWMSEPAEGAPAPAAPPVRVASPRNVPPARPAALPSRDASRAPPSPVAPPSPPTVEISIGTIFVRATTPDAKPVSIAPPVNRAASLAHYLGRRSAGLP